MITLILQENIDFEENSNLDPDPTLRKTRIRISEYMHICARALLCTFESLDTSPIKPGSFCQKLINFDETVSLLTLHQNIIGNNLFAEDAIVLIYHHYHSLHGDKLVAVILKV